jgi:hypothetical protein
MEKTNKGIQTDARGPAMQSCRTSAKRNDSRQLINSRLPPPRYIEGRCEECSLFEICLPKVMGGTR